MAKGSKKPIGKSSRRTLEAAKVSQGRVTSPEDGAEEIAVPLRLLKSIEETAGIKNTPELVRALEKSDADVSTGKTVSWDSVKEKLGL